MTLLRDVARAATAFGFFFGGLPLVARRAAAASRVEARALALAHAARARRLAGIEIALEGAERVPERGPLVVVYNEGSLVQDLANLEVLHRLRIDRAVFAAEYGAIPWFRRAAPRWGAVLLRRGHRDAVERVLLELVAALRSGERISMAPQGRISPDGGVCHFKRGAFLVAIRAGVPVVPVAVAGGAAVMRPGSLALRPGLLRYRVGEPIATAGLPEAEAPALAERVRERVARLVDGETAPRS